MRAHLRRVRAGQRRPGRDRHMRAAARQARRRVASTAARGPGQRSPVAGGSQRGTPHGRPPCPTASVLRMARPVRLSCAPYPRCLRPMSKSECLECLLARNHRGGTSPAREVPSEELQPRSSSSGTRRPSTSSASWRADTDICRESLSSSRSASVTKRATAAMQLMVAVHHHPRSRLWCAGGGAGAFRCWRRGRRPPNGRRRRRRRRQRVRRRG